MINKKKYQICKECVMDTSDPKINFNADGICDHCTNFKLKILPQWKKNLSNNNLKKISNEIKTNSSNFEYDCIIGLSGGLDSSYVAYLAKEVMGLNPLLYHVDAGWNTEQAVSNIEKIVEGLNCDLFTDVIDWNEIKKLQVAFLKSGIPDQDLVQDCAFFSSMYKYAKKFKIKNILTGSNYSNECCREPEEWGGYLGIDKTLFNDIWNNYGDNTLIKSFPIIDIIKYKIFYQKIIMMKVHYPLNYIEYKKKDAEDLLIKKFDWKPFQHKHHESRFTRFFEDFWLPQRFNFEKRRAHFSSLIMTNQMTRSDAVRRLLKPEMSSKFLNDEFEYVADKLDLTTNDLMKLFKLPINTYSSFKNKRWLIRMGSFILRFFGLEKRNLK